MAELKTKEDYIAMLREISQREGRLPRKSDFSERDVNRIKGFFGPWPWALEAAGLRESNQQARIDQNRQKRERSRLRRDEKKAHS